MSDNTDQTDSIEEVETSTNEDTQDTDVELEDIEVSESDITDETEESEESTEEEAATESTEEEAEESEADGDEESSEKVTPSEEDIKKHNAEMAQKRIAEREAKRLEKQDAQQKYIDEANDNHELALRQLQVDAYNNKVERNQSKLESGLEKAVASIDLFTKGTPEQKEQLLREVDKFEALYVTKDNNGDPIDVRGDVYQYLKTEADSISRLAGVGARQQTNSKKNEQSRTLTPPVRTPKQPKVDPDLAAFDEEAKKY
jgi:hypothetical protein